MTGPISPGLRQQVEDDIDQFVRAHLASARLPPPSVDPGVRVHEEEGLRVAAVLLRPEAAAWNQWPDGSARLFNDRAAMLVQVSIASSEPVRWVPRRTSLALNDTATLLWASPGPEELVGRVTWYALMQENAVLSGDLTDRTRAAGAFREACLDTRADTSLEGVIAFPAMKEGSPELSELHVVAVRLSLGLEGSGGARDVALTWD